MREWQTRGDTAALLAGLVTVVLWGSAFVGIRAAGNAFDPGPLALGRVLVSCTALSALISVRRMVNGGRRSLPSRRDLVAIACYGVLFLGLYSITLNAAERRIDAGWAAWPRPWPACHSRPLSPSRCTGRTARRWHGWYIWASDPPPWAL